MTMDTRGDWGYFSVGRGHPHHRPLLLRVRRTLSRQPYRTRFPRRPAGKRGPPAPSRTHRHHAPSRSHSLRRKRWPVAVQPCRNMTPGVRGGVCAFIPGFRRIVSGIRRGVPAPIR